MNPHELIIAVVGPTASGKSDLALDIAESLPHRWGVPAAEIVGCDAMQLYRGMDIGTAKVPVHERRGIAHHQIDVLDVTEEASVAAYQKSARQDIADIHQRGNCAIAAGGSGLYQRALLDVIDFPGTDPAVRARFEEQAQGPLGARGLHALLAQRDPLSASRIDPHNVRRLVRALEVIELTGKPYSSTMPRYEFFRPAVTVGLRWPGECIDERIEKRTHLMFDGGLLEETRALMDRGLREGKTASRGTGYAQAMAVIDGMMTEDEARESVALATRQLARRQMKWLRRDPRIQWIEVDTEKSSTDLRNTALSLIEQVLKSPDGPALQ